jgi:hypothetical protein
MASIISKRPVDPGPFFSLPHNNRISNLPVLHVSFTIDWNSADKMCWAYAAMQMQLKGDLNIS